ncbi:homeobox-domain-containing protein [Trametes coccinea BRFM310]|uniref:Homeobox-domain-containing protein n=1 Tax=Trametes coccinea (strain BRFM310) TaxID=1353009 RepID=A0A1Y2J3Y1_TRAC3|nr:homeobox-domain-containing protein [Trametes coccinea BRFM310]
MSNQQHPDDHFHYGCFPRPNRRGTPTGGNSTNNNNNNNGSRRGLHFGHGGRTMLPSLPPLFRTSRSPAVPDPTHQFSQQDPLQPRSDPTIAPYGQAPGWPVNQSQAHQQGVPFSSDPRFQTQTPYGSYPSRSSPSMIGNPQDSRTLPPLNMPPSQMHPHLPMTAPGQVRSPTGGYTSYAPFPQQHQQPNPYGFSGAPDPRQLPPSIPTMPQYDQPSGLTQRRGSLVDRSARPVVGHGASPYPRVPSVMPPSPYLPDPPQQEPVKKKRKRADAEQLKVLNETYNKTAFPSTEERNELAKKLGMSSRSVQIWFQNKRQAMRQSSRQAAASAPPTTSQPYPTPSHTPASTSLPPQGGYGSHPSSTMGASSISQAGYSTPRPPSQMGGMHHPSGRLNPSPSPSSHRRSHEEEQQRHGRFSPRSGF